MTIHRLDELELKASFTSEASINTQGEYYVVSRCGRFLYYLANQELVVVDMYLNQQT